MAEKRRMSTRSTAEQPATKRRATIAAAATPARSTPKRDSPSIRAPPPKAEERLPTRIDDNTPLPTIAADSTVAIAASLQSIAESGVLAASLQRSRNAWVNEGLFERFWTKGKKKKKGENEELNNPPTNCMQKVGGTCQFIIEPHVFEVILYQIREWRMNHSAASTPAPKLQSSTPAPKPQPSVAYTPSITATITPGTSTYHNGPYANRPHHAPVKGAFSHPSPSTSTPAAKAILPAQTPQAATPKPAIPASSTPAFTKSETKPSLSAQPQAKTPSQSTLQSQQPPHSQNLPPPAQPPPSQDPVIQMLAQRASQDPQLKALMKIVASGSASPSQLKEFQAHIDELNIIVQRQRLNMPSGHNNTAPARGTPQQNNTARPPPHGGTPMFSANGGGKYGTPGSTFGQAYPKTNKPPGPAPKLEVIGLAVEFVGGNGDRYLFPKHCILEHLPGANCLIASFLVVKKPGRKAAGSTALVPAGAAKTKADTPTPTTAPQASFSSTAGTNLSLAYASANLKNAIYQPVTIRITASSDSVFTAISRSVATLDEAKTVMEDVMVKTKRAEDVVLAVRLPRGDDVPEDATPLSSTALVRRASELRAPGSGAASPVGAGGRSRKQTRHEEICECCFTPVAAMAREGPIYCQECEVLMRKSGQLSGMRRGLPMPERKKTEGPKALMLGYDML